MIYLTADTHFGWPAIQCNFRKFKTCKEADDLILEGINSTVDRNDILYIVGDFSERPQKYRQMIKCRDVRMLIGNHDNRNKCDQCFKYVKDYVSLPFRQWGKYTYMNHYPNIYWDQSHNGSYHFYGHTHAQREETLDELIPDRRSMDVGVDNAKRLLGEMRPFAITELFDILADRKGHDPLQFYHDLQGSIK